MGSAPVHDVAIVGGGFAGLSAATALAEGGHRVIVLEARPRLGGRASSFTDPATGEHVDNGQHLLIGGYVETFRFLRRIGSADGVFLQSRLVVEFIDRDGSRSRLQSRRLPAPLHLLGGIIALSWIVFGAWRNRFSKEQTMAVDATAIYWHFMDLLWIYLFLLLFVWRN